MRFHLVDAFTDRPFAGNPAGVVVLDEPADARWMQDVAAEMKHSETAFVVTTRDPKPLRWFTPAAEVDLCGHATIATTHVLGGRQRYATRSGLLACEAREDGWIELDFPADPPCETDDDLRPVLPGTTVTFTGRGRENLFAVLESADAVRQAQPDLEALRALGKGRLVITAANQATDFVSRFFGPGVGVDEDPVTGSAHCTLAPYWAGRTGRTRLTGEQVSARGGIVETELDGDRVLLRGQAVTIVSGELHV
ncbi:PhzF family phenazine biosynthesis protein [Amycolatopsis sp. PS_44_ISF1]|uniref:PhzF family phenazine biosynthesis protein n=1 Tax=Amycolatopsis sp. PS_44_ISF1 TaxID=2974917 RepID=UPI0028DD8F9A|nr:PhzF family phenazine biosynthesis protein [Amycolatopsis sp. PS_44_ISF1]MDT8911147.1 PhzF family phenazine biosynthesis protein [Amycolatopsis sp. PS_44_ISF1]